MSRAQYASTQPVRAGDSIAPAVPPAPPRRPAIRDMLLAAVWIALLTGFVEVLILGVRKLGFGEIIALSQHVVWMAPLGYVLLLAPPALGLAILAQRIRWIRPEHVVGLVSFLAALGIAWMFPRLHRLAMLVLALGLGVHMARTVAAHAPAFGRLVRRTIVPLAALVPLSALVVFGALWMRERSALAALPPAREGAPNVILIILDTVRAANLGLYGYGRPTTPNLERLAQRGVVFDRAISTSPWTLPSHATMFTGRYPHELSASWKTPLDDRFATLAEVLSERGYLTAGFVANTYYGSYEHGLNRGFAHYEDFAVSAGQVFNSTSLGSLVFAGRPGFSDNMFRRILDNYEYLGRRNADDISGDFLDWLGDGRERPYFAFLNYIDAHMPYTPPEDLAEQFGVRPPRPLWHRITGDYSTLTEEQRRAGSYDPDRYDAVIADLDREIGRMVDELDRRNALDNTLVIITADHGEHLGEKGIYAHGNSLYMQNLHVPLLVWHSGQVPSGGRRIRELVSLRSLPATILDLIGADDETRIPGESLAGLWSGGSAPEDPLLSSVHKGINVDESVPIFSGDLHALTAGERHFIRNPNGVEELFDLSTDMTNAQDIAGSPGAGPVLARLRARLEQLSPPSTPPSTDVDSTRRD